MLYKARNKAIKFHDDYFSMMYEAKARAAKGTGPKILTPKKNASKTTNSSCTSKSRQ